ncbi:uncharacterized protein LOC121425992 [Lytechinus variegatus]|uniref:uncharacterized protein LOC121425992 n=1 Tax=Lytechinus variegatus TaxID=7654 RepID=UPI001BB0F317|nr:uncharacterized protein LOC121425992 [Lytechinus variegatus]
MTAQRGVRCLLLLLPLLCGLSLTSANVETLDDLLNKINHLIALECPEYTKGDVNQHFLQLQWAIKTCRQSIASHRASDPLGVPIGISDGSVPPEDLAASSQAPDHGLSHIGLHSAGSWCAAVSDENQWVSVKLPNKLKVTEIAIQGGGDSSKECWIRKFRIEISNDGVRWACVLDSHGQIQYYDGNYNLDGVAVAVFNPSVSARFVRLVPRTYHHCICLRWEVYVEDLNVVLEGEPIGLEDNSFPTEFINPSSTRNGRTVDNIRLGTAHPWCADPSEDFPYVEVDLRLEHSITGIVVGGEADGLGYVEDFRVETYTSATGYQFIKNSFGYKQNFEAGQESSFHIFERSPLARKVRIHVETSHIAACMSFEIYVKELCDYDGLPEGIAAIDDNFVGVGAITASSSWPKYGPDRSPLETGSDLPDFGGSWCAAQESTNGNDEWIQMDLGTEVTFTGVVIRGDSNRNFWVSKFFVAVSDDGVSFDNLLDSADSQEPKVFIGSASNDGYKIAKFDPQPNGRYIRVIPEEWKDCICLRWDVYIKTIEPVNTDDNPNAPPAPECGSPPDLPNGNVEVHGDTPGSIIAWYECDDGYTFEGEQDILCFENGTWDIFEGKCVPIPVECGSPPDLPNGNVEVHGDTPGSIIAWYECDDGYTFEGEQDILCFENGTWDIFEGKCVPIPVECGSPPDLPNGNVEVHGDTPGSTYAWYGCDDGYTFEGDPDIDCFENGTWDIFEGKCVPIPVECGSPPDLPNGNVEVHGDTPGSTYAWYGCDDGYTFEGDPDIDCFENGTWDIFEGKCVPIPVECGPPPELLNGKVEIVGNGVPGSIIAWYDCNGELNFDGDSQDIVCNENGEWPPFSGKCVCGEPPQLLNGNVTVYSRDIPGTTFAWYDCNEGYVFEGDDADIFCNENGTWESFSGVCVITCVVPSISTPLLTDCTMNESVRSGTSCEFSCDTGHFLKGETSSMECLDTGYFSADRPSCEVITCVVPSISTPLLTDCTMNESVRSGTSCEFSCDTGHFLKGETSSMECLDTGYFSADRPSCEVITCVVPSISTPLLTDCTMNESVRSGTSCEFSCDTGHFLKGETSSMECLDTGYFSADRPSCEVITCVVPSISTPLLTNCTMDESVRSGTSCEFSCDTGYFLNEETSSMECLDSGDFSADRPSCEEVTCSLPDSLPSNLKTVDTDCEGGNSITYGKVCDYTCDEGHSLVGSDSVTCRQDSSLSSDLPTCEEVTCSLPDSLPSNLKTVDTDCEGGNSITYGKVCDYTCDEGHSLVGSDSVTCRQDSSLSSDLPTCEEVTCSLPDSLPSNLNTVDTDCEGGNSITYGKVCDYTCDEGHSLVGSHSVTCQQYSSLSSDLPTCEEVTCSIPDFLPPNLNTVDTDCEGGDSINYNKECTYTCDEGYSLVGSDLVICQQDSTLSGELPTCDEVTCSIPDFLPPNLNTVDTDCEGGDSINYNKECTYTCDEGYSLVGSDFVICQQDSTLSGELPTCDEVTCSIPDFLPPNLNTVDTDCEGGDSINYNKECTYTCDEGYSLVGSDLVICQQDSTLSGELPTCDEVTCSIPDFLPPNLNTVDTDCEGGDSINYNKECTYTCDEGYSLVGSDFVICQQDSTLSGELPTCDEVTCSIPDFLPPNLNTVDTDCEGGDSINYNKECTYTCDEGYSLVGSDLVICQQDSTLSGELPTCDEVTCSIPDFLPPNLNTVDTDCEGGDSINYNKECTYTCDEGYSLVGSDLVICQQDSTLSGELPTCDEVTCSIPDFLPPNLNTVDTDCEGGDSINYNKECTYTCDEGYSLVGSDLVICQQDSTLSGELPTCDEVTCSIPDFLPPNLNTVDTDCEGGDSINYNKECTYTCDEGYSLVGSDLVICQQDSTLSGELPTCDVIMCVVPSISTPLLTNCTMDESVRSGTSCEFSCDTGHFLNGETSSMECLDTGDFSADRPSCEVDQTGHADVACANVRNPPGTALFKAGDIDESNVLASSVHHSPNHGIQQLPLVDDEPLAWCANPGDVDVSVTIEFGKVKKITGLVLRGNDFEGDTYDSWVEELRLEYYEDGHWLELNILDANTNPNCKVSIIFDEVLFASEIRIIPTSWHPQNLLCMRVEVYAEEFDPCDSSPCQNGGECSSADGQYSCQCPSTHTGTNCETEECTNPTYPEGKPLFQTETITAQGIFTTSTGGKDTLGLLPLKDLSSTVSRAWCTEDADGVILIIDLGEERPIEGLVFRGNNDGVKAWVQTVKLEAIGDSSEVLIASDGSEEFTANSNADCDAVILFETPVNMRKIIITPKEFHSEPGDVLCMKIEVFEFIPAQPETIECSEGNLPEGGPIISHADITVSSNGHHHAHGLQSVPLRPEDDPGVAWCPASGDNLPLVEIEFPHDVEVFGLVIRGNNYPRYEAWTTLLTLELLQNHDGVLDKTYTLGENADCDIVIRFDSPILADKLIILPKDHEGSVGPCLRVEVYGNFEEMEEAVVGDAEVAETQTRQRNLQPAESDDQQTVGDTDVAPTRNRGNRVEQTSESSESLEVVDVSEEDSNEVDIRNGPSQLVSGSEESEEGSLEQNGDNTVEAVENPGSEVETVEDTTFEAGDADVASTRQRGNRVQQSPSESSESPEVVDVSEEDSNEVDIQNGPSQSVSGSEESEEGSLEQNGDNTVEAVENPGSEVETVEDTTFEAGDADVASTRQRGDTAQQSSTESSESLEVVDVGEEDSNEVDIQNGPLQSVSGSEESEEGSLEQNGDNTVEAVENSGSEVETVEDTTFEAGDADVASTRQRGDTAQQSSTESSESLEVVDVGEEDSNEVDIQNGPLQSVSGSEESEEGSLEQNGDNTVEAVENPGSEVETVEDTSFEAGDADVASTRQRGDTAQQSSTESSESIEVVDVREEDSNEVDIQNGPSQLVSGSEESEEGSLEQNGDNTVEAVENPGSEVETVEDTTFEAGDADVASTRQRGDTAQQSSTESSESIEVVDVGEEDSNEVDIQNGPSQLVSGSEESEEGSLEQNGDNTVEAGENPGSEVETVEAPTFEAGDADVASTRQRGDTAQQSSTGLSIVPGSVCELTPEDNVIQMDLDDVSTVEGLKIIPSGSSDIISGFLFQYSRNCLADEEDEEDWIFVEDDREEPECFIGNIDGSAMTARLDEIEGCSFRIYASIEVACRVTFELILKETAGQSRQRSASTRRCGGSRAGRDYIRFQRDRDVARARTNPRRRNGPRSINGLNLIGGSQTELSSDNSVVEINLGKESLVNGVAIKSSSDSDKIKEFLLQYCPSCPSEDENDDGCSYVTDDDGNQKVFIGNSDASITIRQVNEIKGTCFRIYAVVEGSCSVTVSLLVKEKEGEDLPSASTRRCTGSREGREFLSRKRANRGSRGRSVSGGRLRGNRDEGRGNTEIAERPSRISGSNRYNGGQGRRNDQGRGGGSNGRVRSNEGGRQDDGGNDNVGDADVAQTREQEDRVQQATSGLSIVPGTVCELTPEDNVIQMDLDDVSTIEGLKIIPSGSSDIISGFLFQYSRNCLADEEDEEDWIFVEDNSDGPECFIGNIDGSAMTARLDEIEGCSFRIYASVEVACRVTFELIVKETAGQSRQRSASTRRCGGSRAGRDFIRIQRDRDVARARTNPRRRNGPRSINGLNLIGGSQTELSSDNSVVEINLGKESLVDGVAIKSSSDSDKIKEFLLQYCPSCPGEDENDDGCSYVTDENGNQKVFIGNSDASLTIRQVNEIKGSCFRIYAVVEGSCSVTVSLLVKEKEGEDLPSASTRRCTGSREGREFLSRKRANRGNQGRSGSGGRLTGNRNEERGDTEIAERPSRISGSNRYNGGQGRRNDQGRGGGSDGRDRSNGGGRQDDGGNDNGRSQGRQEGGRRSNGESRRGQGQSGQSGHRRNSSGSSRRSGSSGGSGRNGGSTVGGYNRH